MDDAYRLLIGGRPSALCSAYMTNMCKHEAERVHAPVVTHDHCRQWFRCVISGQGDCTLGPHPPADASTPIAAALPPRLTPPPDAAAGRGRGLWEFTSVCIEHIIDRLVPQVPSPAPWVPEMMLVAGFVTVMAVLNACVCAFMLPRLLVAGLGFTALGVAYAMNVRWISNVVLAVFLAAVAVAVTVAGVHAYRHLHALDKAVAAALVRVMGRPLIRAPPDPPTVLPLDIPPPRMNLARLDAQELLEIEGELELIDETATYILEEAVKMPQHSPARKNVVKRLLNSIGIEDSRAITTVYEMVKSNAQVALLREDTSKLQSEINIHHLLQE